MRSYNLPVEEFEKVMRTGKHLPAIGPFKELWSGITSIGCVYITKENGDIKICEIHPDFMYHIDDNRTRLQSDELIRQHKKALDGHGIEYEWAGVRYVD